MTCQGGQLRVREFQLRSGCPACRYIPGAVQLPFSLSGLGSTTRIRVSVGLDSEWIQLRRSSLEHRAEMGGDRLRVQRHRTVEVSAVFEELTVPVCRPGIEVHSEAVATEVAADLDTTVVVIPGRSSDPIAYLSAVGSCAAVSVSRTPGRSVAVNTMIQGSSHRRA